MEIYLVRHTIPDVEKGICYGQTNLNVASTFEQEAATIKQLLPETFDEILSSPLKRCHQLAGTFSDSIVSDNRIKELDFGSWEMCKWSEIDSHIIHQWMQDFIENRPHGGESYRDLFNRVSEFTDELFLKNCNRLLIVTHGGVIKAIFAKLLQMKLAYSIRLTCDYGGVSKFTKNGEWVQIDYINRVGNT